LLREPGDLADEVERLREEVERLRGRAAVGAGDGVDLEALFPAFPALLFVFGSNDEYLGYRAAERLYAPPEAFLGRRVDEVLPAGTGAALRAALARARETRSVVFVPYSLPFPEGERHFEARVLALADGRAAALCTDVTDQRAAAETARRREEQLEHVLALSPSVVYSLRLVADGFEIASVTDNVERILGYTRDEVVQPGWWQAQVHPEDRAAAALSLDRLLVDGHLVYAYRFRHRGRSWRWIRDELRLVRDAEGRPVEVVGSFSDVTAQREAEERLRESQERFQRAFEDAPIGMALVGLDENFLQVNAALCRILGHPRERLVGMTVPEITHPDDVATEERNKARLLHRDSPAYQMEKRYLHADGHVVWGSLSVSAVADREGRPLYFIGQLEDITHRKLAEQALRDSEERLRELVVRSPDLVVVFDREERITLVSDSATELLGRPSEELRGRSALSFLVPDDAARARRFIAELAGRPDASGRIDLRVIRADGVTRTFEHVVRNLLHVPSVAGFVVNARDVTEQRTLEEQFRQAQKLESVGRLAGGIAHDFNNLLIGILGYAEFLEEGIKAGTPDLEDLAEIRRSGERARDLTRQLLAVARRHVSQPRVIDLNVVVRESEKLLARVLGEDVALAAELLPDLWPVKADPAHLQQVILNLAVNARDAMPRGGRLAIETSNVEVEPRGEPVRRGVEPGAYARLAVIDSGHGMTADTLAHIFEPFFTTKPAGLGTGLGLATVYGIVTQAGGHVTVESAPGQGTRFDVYLPRTAEVPVRVTPRPRAPAKRGSETVLVAEDERSVRELAVRTLEGAGYRVLSAAGGREALELAGHTAEAVHLLVTDVVMPDLSGKDLAAALLRDRPALRVLYVSGYPQDAVGSRGVLDPEVEFLPKPFTPAVLLERIRAALDAA
jgi:PAS domain S-box-containing protein